MEEKNIIKNEKINLSKKEKCKQLVKAFPRIDENILQKIENEFKLIEEQAKNGIMSCYFSNPNEIDIWIHRFYELELDDTNYIDNYKLIENKEIKDLILDEVLTKLTFFIRQDRFCTGLIADTIENGVFENLIKRLDELTQEK